MSRGPRGPRKRTGPAKPKRVRPVAEFEDDEDVDLRDTPEYRKRQAIIRLGTIFLLIVFVSPFLIAFIAGGYSEKQQRQEDQHQQAQQEGTNGAAALNAEIERYQGELKKNPGDPEAQRLLAQCLVLRAKTEDPVLGLKDMAEAQTQFEAVLRSDPENMQVWIGLGNVHAALNKPDKALEVYNKAMELAKKPIDPKERDLDSKKAESESIQVLAHLGLARVHFEIQKKYEEAIADLDAALKINSSEAEAYLLRGRVQTARKQPEAARRDLGLAKEIALQLPEESLERKYILGQYMAAMKQLDPNSVVTASPAPAETATPSNVTVNTSVANTSVANTTAANTTTANSTTANSTSQPLNVTVGNSTAVNGTTPGNNSTP
jgi:tetratricopeptide (TPR) repeat protein